MTSNDSIVAKAYFEASKSYSKMSAPERYFSNEGYLILADTVAPNVRIEVLLYEWITFNVPGGKYTPDFFVLFSDGTVAFVEVKQEAISRAGNKYYAGKSYRDSRSKLRASAELNPWFKFYMAVYNSRDGWRFEDIIPTRGLDNIKGKQNGRETKKTTRS
jgi:hypothetical protein